MLPNGWLEVLTADTFSQISTGTKKVKTKDCKAVGKFPVIDQGQADIAGFVDDESKVINVVKPLVIFGDHTRAIKWIIKDFVPGADGTKVLEAANFLEPNYFYYQLRSLELPDKGYARHFRYLNETSFKVAPLVEQQQITAKLDELLAQVDNLKTRLDTISKILKRFRQSVLAAAISGKLTEDWRELNRNIKFLTNAVELDDFRGNKLSTLPESWQWLTFDQVASVASNLHDPLLTPNAFHIAPNHIESGTGKLLEYTTIANDKVTSAKHQFYSGQILYSKIRPYLCKVAIATFQGLCSADMYPIDAKINTQFLFRWMLSHQFTDWASNAESRSVLPKINQKDLGVIPVPTPPLEEQTEIVARVEQLFTYADQIEQRVKDAQSRVNHLTQAILAKAFRGELTAEWRAQNPELISGENSAKALLARIKAEREMVAKPKKMGKKVNA